MALLWLDLETTGLTPGDHILEVAYTLTHDDLKPHFAFKDGTDQIPSYRVSYAPKALLRMHATASPVVQRMHEENGLWQSLQEDALVLEDIEEQLLWDIEAGMPDDVKPVLAGSGVHFDLELVKRWMPRLADRIHYRIFDVSTLERFFRDVKGIGLREDEGPVDIHRAEQGIARPLWKARTLSQLS